MNSDPQSSTLTNDIPVVVEPMEGAQSVVLVFRFSFGAKDDPLNRLGMAHAAEDTVFKGTPSRDARSIFDAFDNLGVRRGSSTAVEYTDFRAQLLPRHFGETIASVRKSSRARPSPTTRWRSPRP